MCNRVSRDEAVWRAARLVGSGPITVDDVAEIMAATSLYDLTPKQRSDARIKARDILSAGEDAGHIRNIGCAWEIVEIAGTG